MVGRRIGWLWPSRCCWDAAGISTASRRRRGSTGIVGLPNVGKSTLFNALTCSQQAKTGNFPFCTIDPNFSKSTVVDLRLHRLAAFTGALKIVPAEVDVVDVAGLIDGASKGAGQGSQFLANIRPCAVVLHMVRCFESAKNGFDAPQPLEAIATIQNELVLADLEVMEKRLSRLRQTTGRGSRAAGQNSVAQSSTEELALAVAIVAKLSSGCPASDVLLTSQTTNPIRKPARREDTEDRVSPYLRQWGLLTAKPTLYVLNVEESSFSSPNSADKDHTTGEPQPVLAYHPYASLVEERFGVSNCFRISAALEEETAQISCRNERMEFLRAYGLEAPSSERLLHKILSLLGLQTFFTVGPQMARAWLIPRGATVRRAAGAIHSDFEHYFARGRVLAWDAFVQSTSLNAAERAMQMVAEDYVMQDGEVLIVEHSKPQ